MHDRAKKRVRFLSVWWCARAWCGALAQVCAKSFDACAAACAWSGRWHEMCVQLFDTIYAVSELQKTVQFRATIFTGKSNGFHARVPSAIDFIVHLINQSTIPRASLCRRACFL